MARLADKITLRFPSHVSMPAIGGVVEVTPIGKIEKPVKGKMWKSLEDGFVATYERGVPIFPDYEADELEFCILVADRIADGPPVQTENVEMAMDKFGAKKWGAGF